MKSFYSITLITLLFYSSPLWSQTHVVLTEEYFKNISPESTPNIQKIQSDFQNVKAQHLQTQGQFTTRGFSSFSYGESKERSLSASIPINSQQGGFEIGLKKHTIYGVSLQSSLYNQRNTNNFLSDANTNGLKLSVNFDLLKDFLGKSSKSKIKSSELSLKEMTLIKDIQIKQFQNNLRKSYWDLVASQEGLKVSKRLLRSAHGHLEESLRKKKSGIGGNGVVARFRSLVADRVAQLHQLEFQHRNKVENLKRLLPQLDGKTISLGKYNLNKKVGLFFKCSKLIEDQKQTPYHFTKYDEVLNYKSKRFQYQSKIIDSYDQPLLQLATEYNFTGKGNSFSGATDDLNSDGRGGYNLGLQFEMAFGSNAKDTEKAQLASAKALYSYEKRQLNTQLITLHRKVKQSLKTLKSVIASRMENQKYINTLLKDSHKKYRQARITSKNLVDDQDMQLNNELSVIQVQAQIISVMLDYFSVFTETPCELNKI